MSPQKFFPATPDQVVADLERRAPEVRIHPGMTEGEIMFAAGRRSLALELRDFLSNLQKGKDVYR